MRSENDAFGKPIFRPLGGQIWGPKGSQKACLNEDDVQLQTEDDFGRIKTLSHTHISINADVCISSAYAKPLFVQCYFAYSYMSHVLCEDVATSLNEQNTRLNLSEKCDQK